MAARIWLSTSDAHPQDVVLDLGDLAVVRAARGVGHGRRLPWLVAERRLGVRGARTSFMVALAQPNRPET